MTTVLTDIIAKNNKALLLNILDTTGNIVMTENDLKVILVSVLSEKIDDLHSSDIEITTAEDDLTDVRCGCCVKCAKKVTQFLIITKITVGGNDIKEAYVDEYNYIKNTLNISLQRIHT